MSDRMETFEIGESVRVVATTRSGNITVVGGSPGSVRVAIDGVGASDYEIEQVGNVISAESRRKGRFARSSANLVLTVPPTVSLELACGSGDVNVQGAVSEIRASVGSGDVRVGAVRKVCRVNSASGDIRLDLAEDAEINTASGTVRLGKISRSLRLNSASGNVYVDEVGESATSKMASGNIRIGRFDGTEMRLKAMSGDLHLGIPPRRTIELDFNSLSGKLRNKLPRGDGSLSERLLAISVTSVSGNLTLAGADS